VSRVKVTQHLPAFKESDLPPFQGEVASLPELTRKIFVQRFWKAPGFTRFTKSPDGAGGLLLMAEFDGGKKAYVVASLEGADLDKVTKVLPLWTDHGTGT
jgi:hypothetical protein